MSYKAGTANATYNNRCTPNGAGGQKDAEDIEECEWLNKYLDEDGALR